MRMLPALALALLSSADANPLSSSPPPPPPPLQLLPPPLQQQLQPSVSDGGDPGRWDLRAAPRTVAVSAGLASQRDVGGLTLIPPSGREFAEVLAADLGQLTGGEAWAVRTDAAGCGDTEAMGPGKEQGEEEAVGICLSMLGEAGGNDGQDDGGDGGFYTYEDGTPSEEGYELEVGAGRVDIRGTGARGAFWGTRTLLQRLMAASAPELTLPPGKLRDVPAYATRGYLLDAGRKWYAPSFLKDLCTYASFFKVSEFHYHTSDNFPLSRGHNALWQDVYAQFSLRPGAPELQGLVQRANETLDRTAFEDLQLHCARRGITVVPEIEAPGHCLAITKWKPELALEAKDLLNLTHPESIPTVKRIWDEFLPWFQTKEVHIGADEYDASLADDYIGFVNEMAAHIRETAGKKIRIWGTYEPSVRNLTIDKDVTVQHWQYGQSDPAQLLRDGYDVVNSEDWWAYMSLKNDHSPISPAPYPQFFNESRVANFGDRQGQQWEPSLINPVNASQQLPPGARGSRGAILAAWNDNGPDATTQLEAFYAMRRGIPLVAARAWSGARGPELDARTLDRSLDLFAARAPGQNLDRAVQSRNNTGRGGTLLSWRRADHGGPGGKEGDAAEVVLGAGSKGMDYTLELAVDGPFVLSSADAALELGGDGGLVLSTADGWAYPLRAVAEGEARAGAAAGGAANPGRIWANSTASSHRPVTVGAPARVVVTGDAAGGCRAWVDGRFAGRFEVLVYGGRNLAESWSPMAVVAPAQTLRGGGVRELLLREGVHEPAAAEAGPPGNRPA